MADGTKIVPSPPPAEPVDVSVSPSPPPSEPIDVPTYPSPPPAEPVDVQTYPDPPPGGTHDVPTSPDPGPREPVDVSTSPDGPPVEPTDVPTLLDPPPSDPSDVPTLLDGPPIEPIDVPTNQDGPPVDPIDVQVTPDDPPVDPTDVQVSLDPPPATPVDPGTIPFDPGVPQLPDLELVDPASIPFDPGVPPLPDPIVPRSNPGASPSIDSIINAVKAFDSQLGSFLQSLANLSPISVSTQGAGALDPLALADWLRGYLSFAGATGMGKFIAQQAILHAMNPVAARVFNPAYFNFMLIPGSMGNFHATLDTAAGVTAESVARVRDEVLQVQVSLDDRPGNTELNVYGPSNSMVDGQEFSIDEMVDAAVDNNPHPFMKDEGGVKKFDATKYFNDKDSFGSRTAKLAPRARVGIENVQSREATLAASAFIDGIVRMKISPKENPDGAVYSQTPDPSSGPGGIDDDETRIPLCFTDLRKDPVKGYRSIYFRPLNLSFSEQISPEWQEGGAFGRVDPIVAYKSTSRTYSVSFELHAFAPEDLTVMYNKMVWLQSMCYPTYGTDSLLRSGPVIRMRIGDAVSTESGGLSGIIRSLSFDFAEALWELKKGFKVPRSFKVQVDFLALHDGPVGILNGAFGVLQLPPSPKQDSSPGQFTNYVSSGIANAGQPAQAPKGAEIQPRRFSKFGEPKR